MTRFINRMMLDGKKVKAEQIFYGAMAICEEKAGVPALVLPFSSDQFFIAHDAERSGAGVCLDPNAAGPEDVATSLRSLLRDPEPFAGLRDDVRAAGPDRGAARLAHRHRVLLPPRAH